MHFQTNKGLLIDMKTLNQKINHWMQAWNRVKATFHYPNLPEILRKLNILWIMTIQEDKTLINWENTLRTF